MSLKVANAIALVEAAIVVGYVSLFIDVKSFLFRNASIFARFASHNVASVSFRSACSPRLLYIRKWK